MGRAEDLFVQIQGNGITAIDALIEDQAAEELFLDFKQSGDQGRGVTLHHDDNKTLSKAISGFGNAEGGLLVWGVDCRDVNGVETLRKVPLADAPAFRARIESAISRFTTPPHPGVRQHIVLEADGPAGYVVTLIPKGNFGPIRTVGRNITEQYYIRAGDSFVVLPHDALAGLFGRPPFGVLRPKFGSNPSRCTPGDPKVSASLILRLHNPGMLLVQKAYLSIDPVVWKKEEVSINFEPIQREHVDFRQSGTGNVQIITRDSRVIAPGGLEDLMNITVVLNPTITSELRLSVTMGALNAPPARFELYSTADQLTGVVVNTPRGAPTESTVLLHCEEAERSAGQ